MHMSQEIPVTGSMSFTIGTRARVNAYKQTQIKDSRKFHFHLITSMFPIANRLFKRKMESVSYHSFCVIFQFINPLPFPSL